MTPELKKCCLDKIETLSVSIWHIEDKQPFVFCGFYTDRKFCSTTPDVHLQRNRSEKNCVGISFADSIAINISRNTHQEE